MAVAASVGQIAVPTAAVLLVVLYPWLIRWERLPGTELDRAVFGGMALLAVVFILAEVSRPIGWGWTAIGIAGCAYGAVIRVQDIRRDRRKNR